MLKHAFKEWAVICRALAEGRQALILRKGGIAESGGVFTPEHLRFWLYPTFAHQQRGGVKPEALPLLEAAEADRPPEGELKFTHFAEVAGVYHVRHLAQVMLLDDLHLWSEQAVAAKFNYREPGVYVLPVRVYRAAAPLTLPHRPEYDGCRTWVELERGLPTEGAVPVLDGAAFRRLLDSLDERLNPSATV